ncbi:TRAP transporter small permease [Escherichia coli]|nr:TRAP transporter small permease [Escherichia coli]
MQRLITLTEKLLGYILCALLILLTVSVIWQVIGRYLLQSPSTWPDEVARFSLIWVAMLGGAFVYGKKKHLAVTILPEMWVGTVRGYWLDNLHHILVILFGLSVFIGGCSMAYNNFAFGQLSSVLKINMGHIYSAVPVTGILLILFASHFFLNNLRLIRQISSEKV